MKLNQQVCSLELAQKLKTLGVKQESLFGWVEDDGGIFISDDPKRWIYSFSAFTVAELGEMLPWMIDGRFVCCTKGRDGSWNIYYEKNSLGFPIEGVRIDDQGADTEADARTKMLIYLLENKLITI